MIHAGCHRPTRLRGFGSHGWGRSRRVASLDATTAPSPAAGRVGAAGALVASAAGLVSCWTAAVSSARWTKSKSARMPLVTSMSPASMAMQDGAGEDAVRELLVIAVVELGAVGAVVSALATPGADIPSMYMDAVHVLWVADLHETPPVARRAVCSATAVRNPAANDAAAVSVAGASVRELPRRAAASEASPVVG